MIHETLYSNGTHWARPTRYCSSEASLNLSYVEPMIAIRRFSIVTLEMSIKTLIRIVPRSRLHSSSSSKLSYPNSPIEEAKRERIVTKKVEYSSRSSKKRWKGIAKASIVTVNMTMKIPMSDRREQKIQ